MNLFRILTLIILLVTSTLSQVKVENKLFPQSQVQSDSIIYGLKSPSLAMISSALVPGMGQIYNESWWKVPVIWGFAYYFGKVVTAQDKEYQIWKNKYDESGQKNSLFRYYRDFYHDQRDQFAWYLAVTYALNIIDAYVDASLYHFEVTPQLINNVPSINATLKIKLR